jgi:hypothetical protein
MAAEFIEEPVPYFEPEHGALIEADDALEVSKIAYYHACYDFAEKPRQRTHRKLEISTERLAEAFDQQLNVLKDDSTPYEFMVASLNSYSICSENWVDAINAAMEGNKLEHTKIEVPSETDWVLNPEQEEGIMAIIHDSALKAFIETLSTDTNAFVEYVSESKPARIDYLRHEILAHGLDLGKIALGTAAGLIIAKYITREN